MPGGSTSAGSQTQTTRPWSGVQRGQLDSVYRQAGNVRQTPLEYGPSTVAPFGGTTERALQGIEGYGFSGNTPVQTAGNTLQDIMQGGGAQGGPGRGQLNRTAQGAFLGSNPYLDAQYGQAARGFTDAYQTQIAPGIDSRFAAGGRLGSGMHARAQADARSGLGAQLGDMATSMYGGDYARERGLMTGAAGALAGMEGDDVRQRLAAAGLAPGANQAQLGQLQAALGAGSARDDLTGARMLEDQARFSMGQDSPYIQAQRASELLGGSGGYSQSQQPLTRNPAAGFLGGAAAAGGMGSMLGMAGTATTAANPWLAPMIIGGGLLGSM